MSKSTAPPSDTPESYQLGWDSLVGRSIRAWDDLNDKDMEALKRRAKETLQNFETLNQFLDDTLLFFWFFQRRDAFMTQSQMKKWSRNTLDDYVLLPALPGFVLKSNSFFVSHFWESSQHPDPDGKYLRLHQNVLVYQSWSYIWVDWSCMPQEPRGHEENKYFLRSLQTMSGIIRNSGFTYFYPPFKPRLWILYEIAQYCLTCEGPLNPTPDIAPFLHHVSELVSDGVKKTLEKYDYQCSYEGDRSILTSWLELLVLLYRQNLNILDLRRIMDHLTWQISASTYTMFGVLEIRKFEGVLIKDGVRHNFTPFQRLEADN